MGPPTLNTERLILRPLQMSDAPDIQRLAGRKEVASMTLLIPHPYPDGAAEEWISGHPGAFERGESIVFALVKKENS